MQQLLLHERHLNVGFTKGCRGGHLLVPIHGETNDPHACGDASLGAQLGPLLGSAQIAIPHDNECQGERPIHHATQQGLARNVAKPRCPRSADTCGLPVGSAHRGFQVKRGQQLLPTLLESTLVAYGASKWQPVGAVQLNPRGAYISERVRHAHLGARRFKMSSRHSSGGKDLRGVLSDCTLLHLSSTTRLGKAHGRSKLARNVW